MSVDNHLSNGRWFGAVILAACIAASVQAQPRSFEDNIPLELATVLVSQGQVDSVGFYRGVPPDFPDIALPRGVSVLGSMTQRNGHRVVLRAPPDAGQQREALVRAMEASGYRMLTRPPQTDPDQRGFVAPAVIPPGMPVQLCHDDRGNMTVRVVSGGVEPMLVLMGSPLPVQQARMSCDQQEARMDRMGGPGRASRGAQQYMPRLELPPDATSRAAAAFSPFRGISGSLDNARTSTDVSIEWEPGRLHEHFAGQLREQGWAVDSEASGTRSAISGWVGEEEGQSLLGSLQILASGEDQYQVTFQLNVLPE